MVTTRSRLASIRPRRGRRKIKSAERSLKNEVASVGDIKARLSAFLKEAEQGPVVITRNGKAVAVLLAVTDHDELERLVLAHSPKFQALLDKSRRQIEETGGIPHEQFWREVNAESRQRVSKGDGTRRSKRSS